MPLARTRTATPAHALTPLMASVAAYAMAGTAAIFPASDSFSGTGTDSGSVGDANDTIRWTHAVLVGTGSISISSGVLNHDVAGAGVTYNESLLNKTITGSFQKIGVKPTINDSQPAGSVTLAVRLYVRQGGGNDTAIIMNFNGAAHPTPGWTYEIQNQGSAVASDTAFGAAPTEIYFTRTGSTLAAFVNGVQRWSGTNANSMDHVSLYTASINHTGCDAEYDDFVALDGNGNQIAIP